MNKLLLTLAFVLTACSNVVSAHYRFAWLTANGSRGGEYQYIRRNSNFNSPVEDTTSSNMRCNVGASGSGTETVTVNAGSSVTFNLDTAVYHQGPVLWYLGKAPGSVSSWDGSGASWFKIKQEGPSFGSGSASWPMSASYTATIPSGVPSGEYLLRIEQIGLHNPTGGKPQFYISCAQLKINGGSGSPRPTFSIPGHITASDPGITVNIYNNFKSYTFPGPAVATF